MRCLGLTTFQPGEGGGEELDAGVVAGCDCMQVEGVKGKEDGEVVEVDIAAGDNGVLVEDAEGALVDGRATLELRTTWWALTCRSSLVARVTSMMSAATWSPVLDERGSDILIRYSALRLAFLFVAEGLFLFTVLAAGGKVSLVSKENVKVEPMVGEKVMDLF